MTSVKDVLPNTYVLPNNICIKMYAPNSRTARPRPRLGVCGSVPYQFVQKFVVKIDTTPRDPRLRKFPMRRRVAIAINAVTKNNLETQGAMATILRFGHVLAVRHTGSANPHPRCSANF